MNQRVQKVRLWRTLFCDIILLVTLFFLIAIIFLRNLYARRCIENWNGDEFNTYTGYCLSTSYYYDRLNGGWYLDMDNGASYYVKSELCVDGSFRIEKLEVVLSQPIKIVYLPKTNLHYNHMIVSITSGETELLSSQSVYNYMREEASITGWWAIKPVLWISALLLWILCFIQVIIEIRKIKKFKKSSRKSKSSHQRSNWRAV